MKPSMRKQGQVVRAVIFDYGLVLTGPADPVAFASMQELLGAGETQLQAAYWRHRDAYDRGVLSGSQYWNAVADDLHRSLAPEEVQHLLAADVALWTQPNLPMIAWAGELQSEGVLTGILSNLGDEMEMGVRATFPWLGRFAHHTFSHRLGIAKPDAAIYKHAAMGIGVEMEAILFIDDKPENVQAARELGMQAILYGDHAAFIAERDRLTFARVVKS